MALEFQREEERMKRRTLIAASIAAAMTLGTSSLALAQTTLRIFLGGTQRPDVMRQILDSSEMPM